MNRITLTRDDFKDEKKWERICTDLQLGPDVPLGPFPLVIQIRVTSAEPLLVE